MENADPLPPAAPRRPWLFPLVLLAIAVGAIAALTLLRVPLPRELGRLGMELPPAGASPWAALGNNLGIACAWGLYALPVLGMAGLLAAGGFDWAVFATLFCVNALLACDARTIGNFPPIVFPFGWGIPAAALFFGALGGLFAGRLGWSVNRAASLNLLIGTILGLLLILIAPLGKNLWMGMGGLSTGLLALGMLLVVWWLLFGTATGRRLRAIGEDAHAARLAGVARGWPLFIAFALSALSMALVAHDVMNAIKNHSVYSVLVERLIDWLSPPLSLCTHGILWLVVFFIPIYALLFPLLFFAIAACGGGLLGRGRVSLVGLACAALAVPMLDCALAWAPMALAWAPMDLAWASWKFAFWLRALELPALAFVGWRVQRQRG